MPVKKDQKRKRLNVPMDTDLRRALKIRALEEQRFVPELVADAVRAYLKANGKK